ncbi:phosphatidylserine decarboxylase [Salipaludibacillus daqingensis]|uniref:phosphatidylserine decarboxylase n=1 Tax=Salipaludibacillus daqingensis TaxID=3041001 RepID=UPI002476BD3A|nr:phosphatidylserine decarboxylase [Salipaludibacillus daqingensis]
MKKKLYHLMLELTHNRMYTATLRRFTQSKASKWLIPSFVRTFNINTEELAIDMNRFSSLSEFFTRQLKENSRTVSTRTDDIISPVDGVLKEAGRITKDKQFLVKGKSHSLQTMLGLDSAVDRFKNGHYCVLYLSPKDYHRIHSPCKGKIIRRWALGTYSEPVNSMGLFYGQEPLATNYRLITELEHRHKRVAIVKVGALNVNSVHPSQLESTVDKGEEMAYFSFGSTVILLFEENVMAFNNTILQGELEVKQGESIGTWME